MLKSDQEAAIVNVVETIAERRRGETVPQGAAQGDSQGNGEVESWIKVVKEQVRTFKNSLESHIRERVETDHPVWPWMVEWAAQTLNRFRVDEGGRTGTERVRGKRSHRELCIFGERILWAPLKLRRHERADK